MAELRDDGVGRRTIRYEGSEGFALGRPVIRIARPERRQMPPGSQFGRAVTSFVGPSRCVSWSCHWPGLGGGE